MTEQKQFHYYAATYSVWAVAETRAEAIAKVAKQHGAEEIKEYVKDPEHRGLYVTTCRVEVPQDTPYAIRWYVPVGVTVTRQAAYKIVTVGGAVIPLDEDNEGN